MIKERQRQVNRPESITPFLITMINSDGKLNNTQDLPPYCLVHSIFLKKNCELRLLEVVFYFYKRLQSEVVVES